MKTASKTNWLKDKKIATKFLIVLSFASLSACSNNTVRMSKELTETPELTRTNMTDAVGCMGGALKKNSTNSAYLFLVRDIKDGTVKDSVYQDSPLADSGRIQLINVLSEHLFPQAGLVMDQFPLMFSQLGKEELGLNRFGLPSSTNLATFMANYNGIIQGARKAKNLPAAGNVVPLVISGAFTRFDTDNIFQQGSGQNAGTRTKTLADNEIDDRWRQASGQIDIGKTSSAKAISLVLNLVDPRNNLVVASQSFDLIFYRNNKTFRLRVAAGDGYYGVSRNNVTVEGVHSAQKTLIDAAAFWLLNKAYGGQTNFNSCFVTEPQRRLTMTAAKVSQLEKNEAKKSKLNPQVTN